MYVDNKVFLHVVKDGSIENIIGLKFRFFDTQAKDMPQMAFSVNNNEFVFCGDIPLKEKYYHEFKNSNYLWLEAFCPECDREKFVGPLKKH